MTYYYIYQITNLINNKIYVGKHKSNSLPEENGYYGSGKLIQLAIKKYGIDNFKKEIICYCKDTIELAQKELEIVTEEFVKRSDTYNMHKGGFGGFEHINSVLPDNRVNLIALKNSRRNGVKCGGSKNWSAKGREKVISTGRKNAKHANLQSLTDGAREKRKKTFEKIKHSQGSKNSQFGRIWISNALTKEIKRINANDPIPQGWVRGKKGKEKTTCWVNDTVREYLIEIDKKQEYVDKGFVRGRLKLSMPQSRTVV